MEDPDEHREGEHVGHFGDVRSRDEERRLYRDVMAMAFGEAVDVVDCVASYRGLLSPLSLS